MVGKHLFKQWFLQWRRRHFCGKKVNKNRKIKQSKKEEKNSKRIKEIFHNEG